MKFGMKRNEAGFSLVELMIVVGIIGILASLAVPKMQVFMAKARQSEAKTKLNNVNTLQQAYFIENAAYAAYADLGYSMPVNLYANPTVTVTAASGTTGPSYYATIGLVSGKSLCGGVSADYWFVDQSGVIRRSGASAATSMPASDAALTCN